MSKITDKVTELPDLRESVELLEARVQLGVVPE